MTKRMLFSVVELKRLADVANSEGVAVEIEREGTIVRVMPFTAARAVKEKPTREDEAEAALAAWQASQQRVKGLLEPLGINSHKRGMGRGPKI